jgi:sortase A
VTLQSSAGLHSYLVEWTAVVEPDHVAVAGATGYPALTLITCYPFRYVGNAPQRFVVRARRVDEAAMTLDSTAPARAPAPPTGAISG